MPWVSLCLRWIRIFRGDCMELSALEQLAYDGKILLTTKDNYINPFVDFEAWLDEDIRLGHNTCGLLARLFVGSSNMSDEAFAIEYVRCIREIFKFDVLNVFTIVKKEEALDSDSNSSSTQNEQSSLAK